MKYKTGWVPDLPDIRDTLYADIFKVAGASRFPLLYWFSEFTNWIGLTNAPADFPIDLRTSSAGAFPPVFDQGQLGSCVENGWARALAYLESREETVSEKLKTGQNVPPAQAALLSRLFLYYNVRGGVPQDTGSSIRAGVKTVASSGICTEDLWPYDLAEWKFQPSQVAYANALTRTKIQYARILTFNEMIDCLSSGYPFVFGMSVYSQFENPGPTGVIAMPKSTDSYIGGHCLCAVGWNPVTKCFLVANSWGTDWGMAGYCWIPMEYLTNPMLADDFWMARYIPNPAYIAPVSAPAPGMVPAIV